MFALDINATGIDARKDRLVKLAAVDLHSGQTFAEPVYQLATLVPTAVCHDAGLSIQAIQRARPFPEVWTNFVGWMVDRVGEDDVAGRVDRAMARECITLVAQNGHHFVFPLLTKELRRHRISIDRSFTLWDYYYSLGSDDSAPLECQRRLQATLDRFTKRALTLDDLERDNEAAIRKNPQPPFHTSHMRVN